MKLSVNGDNVDIPDSWLDAKLLWFLREHLGLVGSKFGCGVGACGACTVHVDGAAMRSCSLSVKTLAGQSITTIEGLESPTGGLHVVQEAWVQESVPQCGYCQAGQIMAAAALLESNPAPDDKEIDEAMSGNLCRCGTYVRIRKAIHRAAEGGASTALGVSAL